jgi:ABC-type sugar transport system substrate-binding protein
MSALTMMTVSAALIGLVGFVYDTATADKAMACPDRAASVYFETGKTNLNPFSEAVIDRVAAEAKACGAAQVVAQADSEARAKAVSKAFESRGVDVVVVTPPAPPPSDDGFIAQRAAQVRLTLSPNVG